MNNLAAARTKTEKQFRIKGVGDVLLVALDDGAWKDELQALTVFIEERKDFFSGAKLALDIGERKLKAVDMADLRDAMDEKGVALTALFSKSQQSISTARTFGLETDPERIRISNNGKENVALDGGQKAVLYDHTLRSGMKVNFSGNVTILGDVNPGAEVIAEGSIIVWGCIRGKVIAGSAGDEEALICALEGKPLHLRIADIEAKKGLKFTKPVKINCQNAELNYTAWK